MNRIQNDIDNVGINRVPMRFKLNNNGEPKREFNCNSYNYSCPIYREIKRFIKARVGKNIDKVYSEFCSKYPISSHGVLTHNEFWNCIVRGDQNDIRKYFYVDSNKCIREINRNNNKDRKHIKLCPNGEIVIRYKFNKSFVKSNPGLYNILIRCTGKLFGSDILDGDGTISQQQYDKLVSSLFFEKYDEWIRYNFDSVDFTFAYKYIKNLYRKDYVMRFVKEYRSLSKAERVGYYRHYYGYEFKQFLCVSYDATNYTRVYDKDTLKKHFAEEHDEIKKARREQSRYREEYRENLLHNIEDERRRKERQEDLIKRDSHGFDENSFIGHPYHGQQRKNK